jgi:hypothetical protein
MPRPTRNEIYEAVIRKMVTQALEDQELEFTRDHAFDTDEQLLDYIRKYAEIFRYAPRYKEIIVRCFSLYRATIKDKEKLIQFLLFMVR